MENCFELGRTVRFGETDAAGVLHFHHLLRWCHEAYEESLERFGLPAAGIFPTPGAALPLALPIVHCSADFRRPLVCGDRLTIQLTPQRLQPEAFELHYLFHCGGEEVARALTRHVCIETAGRRRHELPAPILRWLAAAAA